MNRNTSHLEISMLVSPFRTSSSFARSWSMAESRVWLWDIFRHRDKELTAVFKMLLPLAAEGSFLLSLGTARGTANLGSGWVGACWLLLVSAG